MAAIAAALAAIAIVLVASDGNPALAASSVVNGNFETGDLTGWAVDTTASGETANAVSSYAVPDPYQYCEWDCPPRYLSATPHEGSYFARLTPGGQSEYTTISQPFTASNGDRVSGWVFTGKTLFQAWGYETYDDDNGQVVLTNGSGATVATLFEDSGSSASDYGSSVWKYWEYAFTDLTGEGQFQIEAKQSNLGRTVTFEPSVLGLDDVKISTVSVAPSAPTITSPKNNTYDYDGSFSVSGSAEAGSTVELFEEKDPNSDPTSKGTTKADSSTGTWSIPLSGVSEGPHTYSAKATIAPGNTSTASNSVKVTVEKAAPTVSTVYPASGSTQNVRNSGVQANFSEPMDPATLTTSTVTLVKSGTTTPISVRVFYYEDYYSKSVSLSMPYPEGFFLDARTKYTVKIKGGTNGVKDLAGKPLANGNQASGDYWWSFTTGRN